MASPRGLSLEIDKSQQSGSQLSGPRQRACYCSLLVLVASKELPGDLNFPLSAVVKKGTFFTVGSGVFCCDLTLDRRTPVFLPFAGVVPRSPCPAVLLPVALVPRAEQGPKCQAQMSGFQPPETCRQSRAGVVL